MVKKTAKSYRTRYPKRGRKDRKKYGRKARYLNFKSAVKQRKNLSTNLLSDAPRVGFKPLKYKTTKYTSTADAGAAASSPGAGDSTGHDALQVNDYGGLWLLASEVGAVGTGVHARGTDKARIKRITGRLQMQLPAVDDQVGTGTQLVGGSERIRVLFVVDKQVNQSNAFATTNVLNDSDLDFTTAIYNETNRKRFKILYDKTFSLTQQVVAAADDKYYAPEVNKIVNFTLNPNITQIFDGDSSNSNLDDIESGAIMMLWGFTNKQNTQFGNTCNRRVHMDAHMITYWTDV